MRVERSFHLPTCVSRLLILTPPIHHFSKLCKLGLHITHQIRVLWPWCFYHPHSNPIRISNL
ncbi:hypothetical protein HanXRQr2_Chr04g0172501 [Helianthus annuus]|uniref:Uncharacterized protein n=1 Tax=Helianthus annuus TaxID=4232 RepID=A0A9K3JAA8_HELAN|nr:hypothetical protein HanXRQr2_Chr04g0172501 [Helianthus annuus]KAJ0931806.1 hypothetical protein HanPSC8_Chr04g0166191 [Helianthus annuus]